MYKRQEWNIVAPDWRGFGPSQWLNRPYFFAEHLGDLEAIVDRYAPTGKVRFAGHSMGGILACLYAGLRPERVEKLITLEGFGIAPTTPDTVSYTHLDVYKRQRSLFPKEREGHRLIVQIATTAAQGRELSVGVIADHPAGLGQGV